MSGLFTTQGEYPELLPAGPVTCAAMKGCPAAGTPFTEPGGVLELKNALPSSSVVTEIDPKSVVSPGKTPPGQEVAEAKLIVYCVLGSALIRPATSVVALPGAL